MLNENFFKLLFDFASGKSVKWILTNLWLMALIQTFPVEMKKVLLMLEHIIATGRVTYQLPMCLYSILSLCSCSSISLFSEPSKSKTQAHKDQLARLKEKDPEFFNFLQENDEELLEFNDSETDDELQTDGSDDDNVRDDELMLKNEKVSSCWREMIPVYELITCMRFHSMTCLGQSM